MGGAYPLQNAKKNLAMFVKQPLRLQLRKMASIAVETTEASGKHYNVKDLCRQGRIQEALLILNSMNQPAPSIYVCLFQVCIKKRAFSEGKLVHAHMIQNGFKPDRFLYNTIMILYSKSNDLRDVRHVFDEMPERDVCSWTTMIAICAKRGLNKDALMHFKQMQRSGKNPDDFTYATILSVYANMEVISHGMEIHGEIIVRGSEFDLVVANALIDMYVKCGSMKDARHVFDEISERDVVSWTAMISGYQQKGDGEEALVFFRRMKDSGVKPNLKTFTAVLAACANMEAVEQGMEIHEEITRSGIKANVVLDSALVDMYAKCGDIMRAQDIFDKMPEHDEISLTVMIAGYAQSGYVDKAMQLFQTMPRADAYTWTVMIAGYMQTGLVDEARTLFSEMPKKIEASWRKMISGYVQNGQSEEALKLFQQMKMEDMKPSSKIFVTVLTACANLAALRNGMEIYEEVIRNGFQHNIPVASALINMYAECGSIEKARNVFDNMPQREAVLWTTMLSGYAMHGLAKEALETFEQMLCSGMMPDSFTSFCVLSVCCHAGLVDEGRKVFDCITHNYHFTPVMEHYVCIVDLLGHAGRLDEAWDVINRMPIKPDASVLGCLLGACRMHGNVELGKQVADCLFEMDPENSTSYDLLSNEYDVSGRWNDIKKLQKMMKEKRLKKDCGYGRLEVNNESDGFLVGVGIHSQMEGIYAE